MAKQRVYHWTGAVRLQHWVHVVSMVVLVFTGFYIHSPFMAGATETMAWMRWFHLVSAYFLVFGVIMRIYLMFNSRVAADWKELFPLPSNLANLPDIIAYYLFLKRTHKHYHRYNPLQALAYLGMVLLIFGMAATGFALHSGWLHQSFNWVNPAVGSLMMTRVLHFLGMWLLIVLTAVHVYFVIRQNVVDQDRTFMSMVDGYAMREPE